MIRRNPNPLGIEAFERNKRHGGRIKVIGVSSLFRGRPFGEVVNMSSSGLLLYRPGGFKYKVDDEFGMEIRWSDLQIQVKVSVAWAKRIGFRKWMIGLAFQDLTENETVVIKNMAIRAAKNDGALSFHLRGD